MRLPQVAMSRAGVVVLRAAGLDRVLDEAGALADLRDVARRAVEALGE